MTDQTPGELWEIIPVIKMQTPGVYYFLKLHLPKAKVVTLAAQRTPGTSGSCSFTYDAVGR